MSISDLSINKSRLWDSVIELARVGATGDGGVCRLALSDEDKAGRDLLSSWLHDLEINVKVDQVGNMIAIRPGQEESHPVLIGSHLDTVRTGGRFDGTAGVLAGLETLRTMEEKGIHTKRPLGLIVFTNEEGARFNTDMMGSRAFSGELTAEQVWAISGIDNAKVGDELNRIGYCGEFPCGGIKPHSYLEMHIEQGNILHHEHIPIGIVEAITGITWFEVDVSGSTNHAGTTPMDHRRDACLAAARMISFLPELTESIPDLRATCGSFSVSPGIINVISSDARFTIDLRNTNTILLKDAEASFLSKVNKIAQEEKVKVEVNILVQVPPQVCDPELVLLIENTSDQLGYSSRRMMSGAGHDAQIMARICPAGMIFIPSREGESHTHTEYSSPENLECGANVLLHTALQMTK